MDMNFTRNFAFIRSLFFNGNGHSSNRNLSVMTMVLLSTLLLSALFATTTTANAEIPMKLVLGNQDTVYSASHTIVGITEPGNLVIVNGTQLDVYSTGAFGTQVQLKKGDNNIEFTLFKGKDRYIKNINVYYTPDKPKEPERMISVSEAQKMQEFNTFKEKLFYVKSLEGAYLQYGDGGDRLGGSKMGYIESGIIVKVVGTIRDLYKVQLSDNNYAYAPAEYFEPTDEETKTVNTGSWYISNIGRYDRVSISLPEKHPYVSWSEIDPTTICVDIYGATNNSNWITQMVNLYAIDYVDFRQPASDIFRVIIKLKQQYQWGYTIHYDKTNLVIDVKHTPDEISLKNLTIGLDAGHGGNASGAVSLTGIKEKDINLDIVYRLKTLLESRGATVVLSRKGDEEPSMSERKKIFREHNIDMLISVHNNAGGGPLKSMGTSAYYKHISNRDFASTMLNRMLELRFPNYGLVGNFNFSLVQPTDYPNVLMEVLFMSSLPDEDYLSKPDNRTKVAEQMVKGLEDYLWKVNYSIEQDKAKAAAEAKAMSKKRKR